MVYPFPIKLRDEDTNGFDGQQVVFYFEGSIYGYQEQCAHWVTFIYSRNSIDVQLRHPNPLILHSVLVRVSERLFALLFLIIFGFEASLAQSLGARVVHFDSAGASPDNGTGIDFFEFVFIL